MPLKSAKWNRLLLWAVPVLVLAGLGTPVAAAGFARVWQTDDGLLNNNIHAIVQTPDDYLWVVTPVSLMRFDGVSFTPFPVKDFTGSIEPHNIRTVVCGKSGVVWVVPNLGPMVGLNPDFSVVPLPKTGLPTTAPTVVVEDNGGSLWVGYANAIYRLKEGQSDVSYTANEGVPPAGGPLLSCDGTGNIWLAKGNQISRFQNGRFLQVATAEGVQCLAASQTNAVWFVAGGHLFKCSADGSSRDAGAFQSPPGVSVDALLEDHTGAVWVGTMDGKWIVSLQGHRF